MDIPGNFYSYDMVQGTHPAYEKNIDRYRFYSDSYEGGECYKDGSYLPHFVYEDGNEYAKRIASTPLANHSRNIIQIYTSFLFSKEPRRDYAGIDIDPSLDAFLMDADLEGRDFNAFMRDASIQASIYGMSVILIDRPAVAVTTREDELTQGIRPYVSLVSAENVIDWKYERRANGRYELVMLKILEDPTKTGHTFRYYYPTHIDVVTTDKEKKTVKIEERHENPLGYIPAVFLYNERSTVRGVGISDLTDIADLQKSIYSDYNELDSTLKLANHPSIVATRTGVDLSAGPGAVIYIDETLPDQLRPYLLQPSGASVDSLLNSIRTKTEEIDRIAHLGNVRTTSTRSVSGVSLVVERQLLHARLQEKANNLSLAEHNIWNIWAAWQNLTWEGQVDYPHGYNIRDIHAELQNLKIARDLAPQSDKLSKEIDRKIAELVVTDPDRLENVLLDFDAPVDPDGPTVGKMGQGDMEHPKLTVDNFKEHIQGMIDEGYTLAEIEVLHPEVTQMMLEANDLRPNN